ncbi:conserved hypothetical protein, membrane [Candidatus Omnitrophus magneticus]|uniref:Chloroplast import component protein (Tic20) n=1 Tax=Candidatus Omnitrophus magneticus TaxID=1609969 RepID=A0A0F0CMZ1_9BACT|nr:conserved hypothetical protein, membrane [Candidatus Omnitrophus magneticus]
MTTKTSINFDGPDAEEKTYAVFSYLGILCFIPFFTMKDKEYVMFHAKQGLILFIIEYAASLVQYFPGVGLFLRGIIMFICVVLSIAGILHSIIGNKWEMPVIADWAKSIKA